LVGQAVGEDRNIKHRVQG